MISDQMIGDFLFFLPVLSLWALAIIIRPGRKSRRQRLREHSERTRLGRKCAPPCDESTGEVLEFDPRRRRR